MSFFLYLLRTPRASEAEGVVFSLPALPAPYLPCLQFLKFILYLQSGRPPHLQLTVSQCGKQQQHNNNITTKPSLGYLPSNQLFLASEGSWGLVVVKASPVTFLAFVLSSVHHDFLSISLSFVGSSLINWLTASSFAFKALVSSYL